MEHSKKNLHYFISDVHLGLKSFNPRERERLFASFLNSLPTETDSIYFLGDIFDFWYEYKFVIPKGFTRTLGAMASLVDRGVKLYFIRGNHDLWLYNFLQEEVGVELLEEMTIVKIGRREFCLAHGDELTNNRSHLFLKKIFKNRVLQRLFSALHPRWAFAIASKWSNHNRLSRGIKGNFEEMSRTMVERASLFERQNGVDYFIFGHLHAPGSTTTPKGGELFVLGEWIEGCQYLVYNSYQDKIEWKRGDAACMPN
ncbi:MAG: UDP-2,3-diacylglucosamine diphosphatase [Bacteroidales bacterium]